MKEGDTYTFQIYDVLDLTIEISLDGGLTYETPAIVENLITDPEDAANQVIVDGAERILTEYEWTVPAYRSRNCIVKFTDNDTGQELLGDRFIIGPERCVSRNVIMNNLEIFKTIYGLY